MRERLCRLIDDLFDRRLLCSLLPTAIDQVRPQMGSETDCRLYFTVPLFERVVILL